jgi:hypothetical protein
LLFLYQVVDTLYSDKILVSLTTIIDNYIKQLEQDSPANDIQKTKLKIAVADIHQFYVNFIKRFKLDKLKEIAIVPIQHYDLIINSAAYEPKNNAQIIVTYLNK